MVLTAVTAGAEGPDESDFALRNGDTVVFLGDSITAARTYGKIVENYTLLRFPGRKVRFVNAGWGGDTAAGGLKRLQRDVFDRGATVLIAAYGVNDIGWGTKADAEHKQVYLDSVRGIAEACRERRVRFFLCSAAITAADPDRAEHDFLQTMCDEGLALARSLGAGTIDVQRGMRSIQRRVIAYNASVKEPKDRESLHAADGIHLSDLGQKAMAFAILKGLGAPAEVSSVHIDAAGPGVVEARGCAVSALTRAGDRLEFTRLDEGLPLNFGLFGALAFRFIPIPDELNRYMLRVEGLKPGAYSIEVDGRKLGRFDADGLAQGVNLSSATADPWEPGGLWDAQAAILIHLTDARKELSLGRLFTGHYLPGHPARPSVEEQADAINERIEELQRTLVKPSPYRFVIRPDTG